MNTAKLSIVIVTYNSEKDIYDCIDSIYKYSDLRKDEYEIIVVDNASRDADTLFSRLEALYGGSNLILLRNTMNGGYGQGNNIGITRATAPIIMIMNPDVRLAEPVFKAALSAFAADDKLSLYGMRQMLGERVPSRNSFACTYMMNGYLRVLLSAVCARLDWYIPRCMYISGACFFLRRSMFMEIGMFDESVFLYGEEDDIRWRLTRRFGTYFKYNKHLRYIHCTLGRAHTVGYEDKLLEVALTHADKKGYSREKMLRNRLQSVRLLLLIEWLRMKTGRHGSTEYDLRVEQMKRIREQMRRETKRRGAR